MNEEREMRLAKTHFTKDEVRKHLEDLGYANVTEDQLKDFVRDLKKLIRYDEKQKRIRAHLDLVNLSAGGSGGPGEGVDDADGGSAGKGYVRIVRRQEWTSVQRTGNRLDAGRASSASSFEHRSATEESLVVQVEVRKGRDRARAKNSAVGPDVRTPSVSKAKENVPQLRENAEPMEKPKEADRIGDEMYPDQILPKRPKIPDRPTTSFIRPPSASSRDYRRGDRQERDPVLRHAHYQKHWERLKLPGDDSKATKQLRWAVREWMMGHRDNP